MTRSILTNALLATLFASPVIHAEEITLQHDGLTLNANLAISDDSSLQDGAVLITHGTLAHNGMDIITTLQELLADEGYNSLAINLSLGQSDRHGMYDCTVPHTHKHSDAVNEIGAWVDWLKSKGSDNIVLMAHSRGGNQTAMFADQLSDPTVKAQILIAPQTWSAAEAAAGYEKRYQQPLQPLLAEAQTLADKDEERWLEKTGFIYCADSKVTPDSFLSYYTPNERQDTPTLLQSATLPTLVFYGSEDDVVPDLAEKMALVSNDNVTTIGIEGSDHFFLDLYADEVIEGTLEFLETL